MTTGGVMFSNVALKEYGINTYKVSESKILSLPLKIQMDVGNIEGNIGIDTETEAAIALWIASPVKIQSLPQNELGAKRLCFDLLTKIAENPAAAVKYKQGITLVMKEAKEKYGVTLSLKDITDFYAETMRKKVYALPLGEPLTDDEQAKAKELLLAYMLNPTSKNAWAFKNFKNNLGSYNVEKSITLMDFVKKISSKVNIQLA